MGSTEKFLWERYYWNNSIARKRYYIVSKQKNGSRGMKDKIRYKMIVLWKDQDCSHSHTSIPFSSFYFPLLFYWLTDLFFIMEDFLLVILMNIYKLYLSQNLCKQLFMCFIKRCFWKKESPLTVSIYIEGLWSVCLSYFMFQCRVL